MYAVHLHGHRPHISNAPAGAVAGVRPGCTKDRRPLAGHNQADRAPNCANITTSISRGRA